MRIGIIGAGRMGQALAMRCAATGHQVMISNSRGPHTLAGVVARFQRMRGRAGRARRRF